MTDTANRALLPAGLADALPPDAGFEADVMEGLIASFAGYGYERVKPPLIEFEDGLLSGSGGATATQTFRLMDPVSQRMLGVRPDMTIQVARIAATRLADAPRPLRLSYAGEVLRVKGSELRPERQFGQIGAELIGAPSPHGDGEIITMAAEALTQLGLKDLSVDLGLPPLVPAVCADLGLDLDGEHKGLKAALNQKDGAAIAGLGGKAADILGALLAAAGPAEKALEALASLDLPGEAAAGCTVLGEVAELVRRRMPGLTVTIDPVEIRGYEYHTGVTFTFFSAASSGDLGRGGRYLTDDAGEAATGVTLFMDSLLRALPRPRVSRRVYFAFDAPEAEARRLRDEGYSTVRALEAAGDDEAEARRMGCTHLFTGGAVQPVEG